jgi:hypothetical protein
MHSALNERSQPQWFGQKLLEHMGNGRAPFAHSLIILCLCNVTPAVRANQSILSQDGHVWDADSREIKSSGGRVKDAEG